MSGREAPRGFEEYVAARQAGLLRTAYLLTGHRQDAEDLVQTALVKVVPHWNRIDGDPDPYVRRVLVRENISRWRRRRWREVLGHDTPEPGTVDDPTGRLDLRASSLSQDVGTLSGGNQQKVVIAKWLATKPKVIILDEPTKGIDIGSKAAVHGFMAELVAEGLSVIMVSSELPEILGMSDRVVVMREGCIAAIHDNRNLDAETLVQTAAGIAA